ncbi:MAG: NfeD family protein [Sterolibacterium sp.]|nr:NfeD family protein [Sterolibacterium sp.]
MQLEWWHWAVGGILLVIAELALPGFVVIWFGLGALLVALLLALLPDIGLTTQLLVWLMVALSLLAVWFKVFRRDAHKTRIGMSQASLLGEIGLLTHDVAPFQKGQMRLQKPMLGSELWPCIADTALCAGERVKVLAVEGSLLKVGKP